MGTLNLPAQHPQPSGALEGRGDYCFWKDRTVPFCLYEFPLLLYEVAGQTHICFINRSTGKIPVFQLELLELFWT